MIKQITSNIWQISLSSMKECVYLIKLKGKNILIDTGEASSRQQLIESLKKLNLAPEDIDLILLTHNHYDHTGNLQLFKNAKVYGNLDDFPNRRVFLSSIRYLTEAEYEECLKKGECGKCEKYEIYDIGKLNIPEIKVIKTPGHTKGSVCFYLPEQKILFSGDTIFNNGFIGRTDFPNSCPEKMEKSLQLINKIGYDILCPGHTY